MAFKEETVENYINLTTGEMVNSILGNLLAILAYFVIKNYAQKKTELETN